MSLLFRDNKNRLVNGSLPVLFTLLVLASGFIMLKDRLGSWWPEQSHLRYLDAGWYKSIVDHGYIFDATAANNTAFFPLFPYVWKWLGVDEVGAAFFNAMLFFIACGFLFQLFPSNFKVRLGYLALSIITFYISPFSESLFFIFSLSILWGLQKRSHSYVVVGIIGAGLARSVCTVFFPAFLILGAFKLWESRRLRDALPYFTYSLISLITLLAVFLIHWYQTGVFWAFTHTQKFWGSGFRIPDLPFTTWDPQDNGYYDQLALFVCLTAIIYFTYLFLRIVARKQQRAVDQALMFSILYFSGIALLMLFTRGGGFNSINRYVFCTPYVYILIRHINQIEINKRMVIALLVVGVAYYNYCWNMGASLERQAVALGLLSLSFLFPLAMKKDTAWANILFFLLWSGMVVVQANLWFRYVTGVWVG